MYILYVDESGSPGEKDLDTEYFVMAGLAVFERQIYFLSEAIDDLQSRYLPDLSDPVEFHASPIRAGKQEPWKRLPWRRRRALLGEVFDIIAQSHLQGVCLFGVAFHKPSYPGADAVEEVLKQLCTRFDLFLANRETPENPERGLLVVDRTESPRDARTTALVRGFRKVGSDFGKLRHFADVPLCADSAATRMLQLADFCAYAVFRRYEHRDTAAFDQIVGRFHEAEGKLHGLVHMSKDYAACHCPACLSRRLAESGRPAQARELRHESRSPADDAEVEGSGSS